jgi:hypothetical protein
VLSDAKTGCIVEAAVLPPEACWQRLQHWIAADELRGIVLGDGTGSRPWRQRLAGLTPRLIIVPEAGSTLAARGRYWQLYPARGWRRLLPEGLRLPPRDIDDVAAQLLLEQHWGTPLPRRLRTSPAP